MTPRMRLCLGSLVAAVLLAAPIAAQQAKVVVLVIGKPGSGKTTQAQKIASKYNVPSISMSELLNKEAGWLKNRTKKSMAAMIASGDFLSDEAANVVLTKHITRGKALKGFVLDGYPMTAQQGVYLKQQLDELLLPDPVVIHLNVSEEVSVDRMLQRGRKDDTPNNIARRMSEYRQEEEQMLSLFPAEKIHVVDGSASVNEVWRDVQAALKDAGY